MLIAGVLCLLSGCVSNERPRTAPDADHGAGGDSNPTVNVMPIIGGVPETGFDNVGFITAVDDEGTRICTGTAIAPSWVLTAAHCVVGYAPSAVQFHTGTDYQNDRGTAYDALALFPHHIYENGEERYDIALIRVDGLSEGPFYDIHREPVAVGMPVTWIGYGSNQYTPVESGGGIKRRGDGTITGLALRTIQTEAPGGVLLCHGDSGGPGFVEVDGELRIAGVASEGDCSTHFVEVRVDGFARWIALTMAGKPWTDCDMTGGDCANGACFLIVRGDRLCFPSEGLGAGEICSIDLDTWTTGIPCADGLGCRPLRDGTDRGACFQFCYRDTDCPAPLRCDVPTFSSIEDLGVCRTEADDLDTVSDTTPEVDTSDAVDAGTFDDDTASDQMTPPESDTETGPREDTDTAAPKDTAVDPDSETASREDTDTAASNDSETAPTTGDTDTGPEPGDENETDDFNRSGDTASAQIDHRDEHSENDLIATTEDDGCGCTVVSRPAASNRLTLLRILTDLW